MYTAKNFKNFSCPYSFATCILQESKWPVRSEERATNNFSVLLFQRPVAFVGVREGLLDGIVTLLAHCVSQVSDLRSSMTFMGRIPGYIRFS